MLNEPFCLDSLKIPNRVLLSPLAGVSDVPFRRICQEFGAGLTYIEMLSAAGMKHNTKKTGELLARHPAESILGAQITGPRAEVVAEGSRILEDLQLPVDTLDLNMGCPVKKIVAKGSGSALVKDPELAGEVVRAVSEAVSIPVTAKIRLGFFKDQLTVEEVCTTLTQAGARMIIIHGRTRDDTYSDPIQYDRIRDGFQASRAAAGEGGAPVLVGNGNVFDLATAKMMVERTGCDAVLISRGALGNPWLFSQILNDSETHPQIGEWCEVLRRHARYHEDFYGDGLYAAIRFRKHLLWYLAGFPNCRPMRQAMSTVATMADVHREVQTFADSLPQDFERFDNERLSGWRLERQQFDPKGDMDRKLDRGVETEQEFQS